MKKCYDLAIIGSGLIGSAAAKYASKQTSNCILIGPGEQQDSIYAAWYDSGRIAEVLDQTENWMHLALKSIEKYRQIEKESGIEFFQEVGFLTVHDDNAEKELVEKYQKQGIHCQSIKPDFRFLRWPPSCQAYFQEKGTLQNMYPSRKFFLIPFRLWLHQSPGIDTCATPDSPKQ